MLSCAEAWLVDRDPDLPGLALLLDTDVLASWLSDRLVGECRVAPRRLRYKPTTSCVLSFELETRRRQAVETEDCIARVYSSEASAKAVKLALKVPAEALLAVDHRLQVVVTSRVGDRDLKALGKLHDDVGRKALFERIFPGREDLGNARIFTLRHNPERRWVGLVRPERGVPFVLRAYEPGDQDDPKRAYSVLQGSSACRTPTLLGASRRYALLAVEWVPGSSLAEEPAARDGFAAAGEALARLHQRTDVRLPRIHTGAEAQAVRGAAEVVASLAPDLATETHVFAHLLADKLQVVEGDELVHGDFSADQVIRGEAGHLTLIDVDTAGVGDPSMDLGCACAAIRMNVGGTSPVADSRVEALLAGYESVRRLPASSRLAAFEAAHLLRKAVEPFRHREPDWSDRLAATVRDARRDYDAARSVGKSGR